MTRIVTRLGDRNSIFHKCCFIDTEYDDKAREFVALCRVIGMAPDGQQESHDRPVVAYHPDTEKVIEICLDTVQQRNPERKNVL